MARRKKEIIMPHLNDCFGDLRKKWYVEYSIRNPESGKMERNRVYDKINQYNTKQERFNIAQEIIKDYSERIESGKISFKALVPFRDRLLYDGAGSFSCESYAEDGHIKIYLSEFLSLKELEVGRKSYITYQSKLRSFCLYAENRNAINKPVTFYTNEFISDFLRNLVSRKKLARKSIEKYVQILFSFFKYLEKKKIVRENPVHDMPRIGLMKDEAPAAIPKNIRDLFNREISKKDPQLWMFVCFIYYMAIRPGHELRLMKLNQIDYQAKRIQIPSYIAKNRETESISIPDDLYKMITEDWGLQNYNQDFYVFGKCFEPGKEHLSINNMSKRFNAFRDYLSMPKSIKLYSWKHSGAQELASQGVSPYELQRHLRHKNLNTTEMYLKKRIGERSDLIRSNFPSI